MNHCKDCKFWEPDDQTCNYADWLELENTIVVDEFGYYAYACDDSGLSAGIKTGPTFGCIKWVSK